MLSFVASGSAWAQAPGDDFKQSLTGGFIYAIPVGDSGQNPAPGYSVNYVFRPFRWLGFEAGLEQAIHPVGTFITQEDGNRFSYHANDQLFLVPFGPRMYWSPQGGRARLSVGAGGAYLNHSYGPAAQYYYTGESSFGIQALAAVDYALSPANRFRLGMVGRYYYVRSSQDAITRVFTIGPSFTFSFR